MKQLQIFFIGVAILVFQHTSLAQNVGIGIANPGFPLNMSFDLGDKISLWGTNGYHYGLGVQSGLLQIHSDAPFAHIGFGYGSSADFNERMRLINEGEMGLSLNGRILLKNGSLPLDPSLSPGIWMYKPDNSEILGFVGVQNNQNLGFYGGPDSWGLVYDAVNSRVGIGNNNPANKLDVNGDVNITGKLKMNGITGTSGQVLVSNGNANPPTWQNSPVKQMLFSTFFAGGSSNYTWFSPISQSTNTNSQYYQNVEFIMPYAGKIETLKVQAFTTFVSTTAINTITISIYKNGSFQSNAVAFDAVSTQNASTSASANLNISFNANDRICYSISNTEQNVNVKVNCTLGISVLP